MLISLSSTTMLLSPHPLLTLLFALTCAVPAMAAESPTENAPTTQNDGEEATDNEPEEDDEDFNIDVEEAAEAFSLTPQKLLEEAEAGNVEAQLLLAQTYGSGELAAQGIPLDAAESMRWYRKAAEAGHPLALEVMAAAYRHGQGAPKDMTMAIRCYRQAGQQGSFNAWFELTQIYFRGEGTKVDWDESFRCLKRAESDMRRRCMLDPVILSTLAVYYDNGIGTAEDKPAALRLLREILEKTQGTPKAYFLMGQYCDEGVAGLKQDSTKAMQYYREAAIMGDKEAQCNLGSGYAMGKGVRKDMNLALVWFRASAQQGCATALLNMGRCYALGDGVPQDFEVAYRYFEEAAKRGNKEAAQYLKEFEDADDAQAQRKR